MFVIERSVSIDRPAGNYENISYNSVSTRMLPATGTKQQGGPIESRVPLGRLHEKMKNKRTKYLIGDLMQLSS